MVPCRESDRALRCGTFEILVHRSDCKLVYHIIAHRVPDTLLLSPVVTCRFICYPSDSITSSAVPVRGRLIEHSWGRGEVERDLQARKEATTCYELWVTYYSRVSSSPAVGQPLANPVDAPNWLLRSVYRNQRWLLS